MCTSIAGASCEAHTCSSRRPMTVLLEVGAGVPLPLADDTGVRSEKLHWSSPAAHVTCAHKASTPCGHVQATNAGSLRFAASVSYLHTATICKCSATAMWHGKCAGTCTRPEQSQHWTPSSAYLDLAALILNDTLSGNSCVARSQLLAVVFPHNLHQCSRGFKILATGFLCRSCNGTVPAAATQLWKQVVSRHLHTADVVGAAATSAIRHWECAMTCPCGKQHAVKLKNEWSCAGPSCQAGCAVHGAMTADMHGCRTFSGAPSDR